MRLSDRDIHNCLEECELVIVGTQDNLPFEREHQVQPCSIDLRLDNVFIKFKDFVNQFDVKDLSQVWDYMERYKVTKGEQIIIKSRGILYGQIYEQLRIPDNCSGFVEGKSRFARLGLSIHTTGSFINPGFEGAMPLQIVNHNNFPIVLYPYMMICQLSLFELKSEVLTHYSKRTNNPYNGENEASPSVANIDPIFGRGNVKNTIHGQIEKKLVDDYYEELKHKKYPSQVQRNYTIIGKYNTINDSSENIVDSFNVKTEDINKDIKLAKIQIKKIEISNEEHRKFIIELLGDIKVAFRDKDIEAKKECKIKFRAFIKLLGRNADRVLNIIGSFASLATFFNISPL